MPLFTTSTHLVSYGIIYFVSSRMMMQHWMSWQEVIAQAYLFEEKSIGKKKHNRSSSTPASPVQKRKKRLVSALDCSPVSKRVTFRSLSIFLVCEFIRDLGPVTSQCYGSDNAHIAPILISLMLIVFFYVIVSYLV
jgi:hypothetical protein